MYAHNYLIEKNKHYQNLLGQFVDTFNVNDIMSRPFIKNAIVEGKNDLSDMNIIKGQKTLILKSIFENRAKFIKTEEDVTIRFVSTDPRYIHKALVLTRHVKGDYTIDDQQIVFNSPDMLLNLRRLDFFKVNINALKNVKITVHITKLLSNKYRLWYNNEICN